ncbi:hypothetical protein ACGF12_24705 [Kitasatospora sp. NPDC048296]|uniref:allene oxide cyclase barrel-like domain-containing protein n=1 Tax=Kitasatospora sp. NPDC048296 TaxID=3364048 RepID=UPI0037108511
MRRTKITRRTGAALALALGLLVTVPATAGTASADPGQSAAAHHRHQPRSIDLYPLQEKVLERTYTGNPATGFKVGDGGTWHSQLSDADGEVISDTRGTSLAVYQGADGLYTIMDNTDVLEDGTVHSYGLVNTNKLMAGENIMLPVVGGTGRYEGYIGFRSFQKTTTEGMYNSRIQLWKSS